MRDPAATRGVIDRAGWLGFDDQASDVPEIARDGGIGTMDDRQGKEHGREPGKGQGNDARQQRLKQALRDNLRRRKAQTRQRSAGDAAPSNLHEAAIAKDAGERDE
jgi:hypothetical protein